MAIATTMSAMSTCASKQVGAVLVKNNRILSTGYNGAPSGVLHCNAVFGKDFDREAHHKWSHIHELHAEVNAIIDAGKRGTLSDSMTLYVTLFPCIDCVKQSIAAGVKEIIYLTEYDLDTTAEDVKAFCAECNVHLFKISEL
jgi:dCMP deaminase